MSASGDSLAAFLLGTGPPPPARVLRSSRLASYAYATLPSDHPLRPELRADYLRDLVRHHEIRRELRPLLAAWRSAGIEALLFKGFHLGEFVYPTPGTRFYGDVDVLLKPDRIADAARIASGLGWARENESAGIGLPHNHTAFSLYTPTGATYLEVHRSALQSWARVSRTPDRITDAAWAASVERDWDGVMIRELAAVDALLMGLILQRSWGDRWTLKSHDILDFRFISERCGVSREQLRQRASVLGCMHTLRLFLERCDPEGGRLDISRPGRLQAWGLALAVGHERFPAGIEELASKIRRVPDALVDARRAFPAVRAARRVLRRSSSERSAAEALTVPIPPDLERSLVRRMRLVRGIRWTSRLYRSNPGNGLLRSLTVYGELRQLGWPVQFVAGAREDPGAGMRYWVELDGRVLQELHEPWNPVEYRVTFRFPPDARPGQGSVARADRPGTD
jgi:hypothetical protein